MVFSRAAVRAELHKMGYTQVTDAVVDQFIGLLQARAGAEARSYGGQQHHQAQESDLEHSSDEASIDNDEDEEDEEDHSFDDSESDAIQTSAPPAAAAAAAPVSVAVAVGAPLFSLRTHASNPGSGSGSGPSASATQRPVSLSELRALVELRAYTRPVPLELLWQMLQHVLAEGEGELGPPGGGGGMQPAAFLALLHALIQHVAAKAPESFPPALLQAQRHAAAGSPPAAHALALDLPPSLTASILRLHSLAAADRQHLQGGSAGSVDQAQLSAALLLLVQGETWEQLHLAFTLFSDDDDDESDEDDEADESSPSTKPESLTRPQFERFLRAALFPSLLGLIEANGLPTVLGWAATTAAFVAENMLQLFAEETAEPRSAAAREGRITFLHLMRFAKSYPNILAFLTVGDSIEARMRAHRQRQQQEQQAGGGVQQQRQRQEHQHAARASHIPAARQGARGPLSPLRESVEEEEEDVDQEEEEDQDEVDSASYPIDSAQSSDEALSAPASPLFSFADSSRPSEARSGAFAKASAAVTASPASASQPDLFTDAVLLHPRTGALLALDPSHVQMLRSAHRALGHLSLPSLLHILQRHEQGAELAPSLLPTVIQELLHRDQSQSGGERRSFPPLAFPALASSRAHLLQLFRLLADDMGQVDVIECAVSLSSLCSSSSAGEKLRFGFHLLDADSDGYIEEGELGELLRALLRPLLPEAGSAAAEFLDEVVRAHVPALFQYAKECGVDASDEEVAFDARDADEDETCPVPRARGKEQSVSLGEVATMLLECAPHVPILAIIQRLLSPTEALFGAQAHQSNPQPTSGFPQQRVQQQQQQQSVRPASFTSPSPPAAAGGSYYDEAFEAGSSILGSSSSDESAWSDEGRMSPSREHRVFAAAAKREKRLQEELRAADKVQADALERWAAPHKAPTVSRSSALNKAAPSRNAAPTSSPSRKQAKRARGGGGSGGASDEFSSLVSLAADPQAQLGLFRLFSSQQQAARVLQAAREGKVAAVADKGAIPRVASSSVGSRPATASAAAASSVQAQQTQQQQPPKKQKQERERPQSASTTSSSIASPSASLRSRLPSSAVSVALLPSSSAGGSGSTTGGGGGGSLEFSIADQIRLQELLALLLSLGQTRKAHDGRSVFLPPAASLLHALTPSLVFARGGGGGGDGEGEGDGSTPLIAGDDFYAHVGELIRARPLAPGQSGLEREEQLRHLVACCVLAFQQEPSSGADAQHNSSSSTLLRVHDFLLAVAAWCEPQWRSSFRMLAASGSSHASENEPPRINRAQLSALFAACLRLLLCAHAGLHASVGSRSFHSLVHRCASASVAAFFPLADVHGTGRISFADFTRVRMRYPNLVPFLALMRDVQSRAGVPHTSVAVAVAGNEEVKTRPSTAAAAAAAAMTNKTTATVPLADGAASPALSSSSSSSSSSSAYASEEDEYASSIGSPFPSSPAGVHRSPLRSLMLSAKESRHRRSESASEDSEDGSAPVAPGEPGSPPAARRLNQASSPPAQQTSSPAQTTPAQRLSARRRKAAAKRTGPHTLSVDPFSVTLALHQQPSPRALLSAVKVKPLPVFTLPSHAPKLLLCIPLHSEDSSASVRQPPTPGGSPGASSSTPFSSVQSIKVYDGDLVAFTFFKARLAEIDGERMMQWAHQVAEGASSSSTNRAAATATRGATASRGSAASSPAQTNAAGGGAPSLFATRLTRLDFAAALRALLVPSHGGGGATANPSDAHLEQQLSTYTVALFRLLDHASRGSVLLGETLLGLSLFLPLSADDKLRFAFQVLAREAPEDQQSGSSSSFASSSSHQAGLSEQSLRPFFRAVYCVLAALCSTHFRMSVPSRPGSPATSEDGLGPLSPSSLHSLPHELLQARLEATARNQSQELFRLAARDCGGAAAMGQGASSSSSTTPGRHGAPTAAGTASSSSSFRLSEGAFLSVTREHRHLLSFLHAIDLDSVFSPKSDSGAAGGQPSGAAPPARNVFRTPNRSAAATSSVSASAAAAASAQRRATSSAQRQSTFEAALREAAASPARSSASEGSSVDEVIVAPNSQGRAAAAAAAAALASARAAAAASGDRGRRPIPLQLQPQSNNGRSPPVPKGSPTSTTFGSAADQFAFADIESTQGSGASGPRTTPSTQQGSTGSSSFIARATLALVMLACCFASCVADWPLEVYTDSGWLMGFSANGTDRFTGVPYAAAPIGPLRFAPPQEHEEWSDVRLATGEGVWCAQSQDQTVVGQEDCLLLNLFAPANRSADDPPLPTYVFVHGGGWVSGTAMNLPLEAFALQHNVIAVAMNYRLGPLGFWSLPSLQRENSNGAAGNWGLLDQVAALQWIQKNIAAFGGDNRSVTLTGESAGGLSVCALLASPLARGLFASAVIESGNCESPSWFSSQEVSFAWGTTATGMAGCPTSPGGEDVACLRKMNVSELIQATSPSTMARTYEASAAPRYTSLLFPLWSWSSVIDGSFLLFPPLEHFARGAWNAVPVIAGSNRDEMENIGPAIVRCVPGVGTWPLRGEEDVLAVLNHFFGRNATANSIILAQYPSSAYADATEQFEQLFRDYFYSCPMTRALQAMNMDMDMGASVNSSTQVPAMFHYVFSYRGARNDTSAFHSAELRYVWLENEGNARDETMSNDVSTLWANLVRSQASPNPAPGIDGGMWPRYESSGSEPRVSLVLDEPLRLEEDVGLEACAMWASIAPWTPPVPTVQRRDIDRARTTKLENAEERVSQQ